MDPKSAEIIRPILRGRDIKRYGYNFANLWLINMHNGIKEKGIKPINIDTYPAIKNHLEQFLPELEKRLDKGITPYNLRNCAYMEDFSKQKIVFPEITKFLNFSIDDDAFFANNKCFILTGENLYFLCAFLNSSLFKFCYKDNFPELLGGSRELRKIFMDQIPVRKVTKEVDWKFKEILAEAKGLEYGSKALNDQSRKIDNALFQLYNLTPDEKNAIGFIEIQ